MTHFQVLIIGGGNAGISTAAQLLRKKKDLQIAIIEPSDKHYYQPAWTLVGAGVFDIKKTIRTEASVIPHECQMDQRSSCIFSPTKKYGDHCRRKHIYLRLFNCCAGNTT